MTIPQGTRKLVELREVAERLGTTYETVRHWWKKGRLLGRLTEGKTRKRVTVPIEVVEFYLRYFRLPTRLDLYEAGGLSEAFLRELTGPDGGLCEVGVGAASSAKGGDGAGRLRLVPLSPSS